MSISAVAPLAGAWIEIRYCCSEFKERSVAPLAGAWIEMTNEEDAETVKRSLPSRERGLKSAVMEEAAERLSRSPRGGVD